MKIVNYQYQLHIRNKKEPIWLNRIEAEALMVVLAEGSDRKFVTILVQVGDKRTRYFMSTSDIVLIEPQEGWHMENMEIELTLKEETIHKAYLEKVEKESYFKLPLQK